MSPHESSLSVPRPQRCTNKDLWRIWRSSKRDWPFRGLSRHLMELDLLTSELLWTTNSRIMVSRPLLGLGKIWKWSRPRSQTLELPLKMPGSCRAVWPSRQREPWPGAQARRKTQLQWTYSELPELENQEGRRVNFNWWLNCHFWKRKIFILNFACIIIFSDSRGLYPSHEHVHDMKGRMTLAWRQWSSQAGRGHQPSQKGTA